MKLIVVLALCLSTVGCTKAGLDITEAVDTCQTKACYDNFVRQWGYNASLSQQFKQIAARRGKVEEISRSGNMETGTSIVKYRQGSDTGACYVTVTFDKNGQVLETRLSGDCAQNKEK